MRPASMHSSFGSICPQKRLCGVHFGRNECRSAVSTSSNALHLALTHGINKQFTLRFGCNTATASLCCIYPTALQCSGRCVTRPRVVLHFSFRSTTIRRKRNVKHSQSFRTHFSTPKNFPRCARVGWGSTFRQCNGHGAIASECAAACGQHLCNRRCCGHSCPTRQTPYLRLMLVTMSVNA